MHKRAQTHKFAQLLFAPTKKKKKKIVQIFELLNFGWQQSCQCRAVMVSALALTATFGS